MGPFGDIKKVPKNIQMGTLCTKFALAALVGLRWFQDCF